MAEMPEVLMPDQSAPGYPDEFRFSPTIESYYRRLPRTLRRNWDAFGSGSAAEVPVKAAVRGVEGTERARLRAYEELASQLGRRFLDLQAMDRRLAEQVRRSLAATRTGQEQIEAVIHRVNADAGTVPIGSGKGEHILRYLPAGLDRVEQVITETTRSQHDQAGVIGELVRHLTELTPSEQASTVPTRFRTVPAPGPVPRAEDDRSRARMDSAVGSDNSSALEHRGTSAAAELSLPAATRPLTPEPPTGHAASATPGTFRPGVEATDPDRVSPHSTPGLIPDVSGRPGRDPSAEVGETAPHPATEIRGGGHAAPSVSAGTTGNSTPWGRRADSAPGRQQTGVASSGKRTEAGANGRKTTPPTDRTVVYVFPDGRTQEVPPMVAQILDAAFGNRPGPDVRYGSLDSGATAPPGEPVDTRREPPSVVTGDIAVWARRRAVIVVFGAGNDRTHEVIVDGRLRPFSTRMGDGHNEFGPFTGFRHLQRSGPNAGGAGASAPGNGHRLEDEPRGGERAAGVVASRRFEVPGPVPVVETVTENGPADDSNRTAVAGR